MYIGYYYSISKINTVTDMPHNFALIILLCPECGIVTQANKTRKTPKPIFIIILTTSLSVCNRLRFRSKASVSALKLRS